MKILDLINMCDNIIDTTRISIYYYDKFNNRYIDLIEFPSYISLLHNDTDFTEMEVKNFIAYGFNGVKIEVEYQ